MKVGLILILVLAVASGACGRGAGAPGPGSDGDGPLVAASVYPLADAAERVGGAGVRVANLTASGGEAHDLELSSNQVDALLDADLVLYVGAGFQPAVEEVVSRRDGPAVDVLRAADPLPSGEPGQDGDDHDEAVDPHVWLDPVRMARVVAAVSEALAEAAPEGAAGFRDRGADYERELRELDRRFRDTLATCRSRVLVTAHAAFGYLADRYDLREESVAGVDPESEPDPERLADLVDLVRREGVTTVFAEANASRRVAETLAREAGADVAVLHPLEALGEEERARGGTYVSVMDDNLLALEGGLRCDR